MNRPLKICHDQIPVHICWRSTPHNTGYTQHSGPTPYSSLSTPHSSHSPLHPPTSHSSVPTSQTACCGGFLLAIGYSFLSTIGNWHQKLKEALNIGAGRLFCVYIALSVWSSVVIGLSKDMKSPIFVLVFRLRYRIHIRFSKIMEPDLNYLWMKLFFNIVSDIAYFFSHGIHCARNIKSRYRFRFVLFYLYRFKLSVFMYRCPPWPTYGQE